MKTIKYILISLALVWMTTGCGTDDQSPQSGPVNTGTENAQEDANQGTSSEDDLEADDVEIDLKLSTAEADPSNWYIRLVVENPARAMKSDSSKLGTLEVNGVVEDHTLKAVSPFGSSYLSIIFIDPDGVEPGAYKTNFHAYQENVEDQWKFTVKTDDTNADITLTWRGLYVLTPYIDDEDRTRYKEYRSETNPLIKHLKLVDTVNGQEIAVIVDGKVGTYTFNMDGQTERTFEWIVQTEVVDLLVQSKKSSVLQAKTIKKDSSEMKQQIIRKKAETFDLSKPPMIK